MRMPKLHITLITGVFMTAGMAIGGSAMAGQSDFCLTGTVSSEQQRIDCAGRWISADGTRFGPRVEPRDTPRTPHPAWRSTQTTGYGQAHASTSRTYSTHQAGAPTSVWTPPAPYQHNANPVVVTRGNHSNSYDGNYDVYVPTRPHIPPVSTHHSYQSTCGSHGGKRHHDAVSYCDTRAPAIPVEGCFSLGASGQAHPVPCPTGGTRIHTTSTYAPRVQATAHASANVTVSNTAFFNSLSGGVGGGAPAFFGGGGGTFISGGGGSVLSRAPLIRFRSKNRGRKGGGGHHGGGCDCSGGGMMGMGGGD